MESPSCSRECSDSSEVSTSPTSNLVNDKPKKFRFKVTLEPLLVLTLFGTNISGIVLTNLLLIRSCELFGFPAENCTSLDVISGTDVELTIQPYVSKVSMYKSVFEAFLPALMSFFLGSWSDTYGRRPLFMISLLGYSLYFILLIGFSLLSLPPLYVLVASIALVIGGGNVTFFAVICCYISDITVKHDRAFRLAVIESMVLLGFLLGNLASSYLYALFPTHGFEGMFTISFSCCMLSLLLAVFFLEESVENCQPLDSGCWKSIFQWRRVSDLYQTCFGSGRDHSRAVLLLVSASLAINLLCIEGNSGVLFLFVREKFLWTLRDFTTYVNVSLLLVVGGAFVGTTVFSRWLQLPPAPVTSFVFLVKSGGYLLAGWGTKSWSLYASSAIGSIGGCINPLGRALVSNTVEKKDIGKVFVFMSSLESLVPIVASPAYTFLYNSTLKTLPGAVFFLTAALLGVCCSFMCITAVLLHVKPGPDYSSLETESVEAQQTHADGTDKEVIEPHTSGMPTP